ncbi:hypothetical protein BCD_1538 (plasmid) [Borrelia crocidurae DOU]|uniref:Uncharacterized protein n=1 Tax=Borrelia crocidurae DOU TaxID=1293575 RepID=W5SKC4_9SPIR|nr:hypothetical protein [Borrelia crocidurae]AHH07604.1 hypothetical protein BCD_1538 [Borrelia crocidurae DOU]
MLKEKLDNNQRKGLNFKKKEALGNESELAKCTGDKAANQKYL